MNDLHSGARSLSQEHRHQFQIPNIVQKRELDLRIVELGNVGSLRVFSLDLLNSDNLEIMCSGSMPGSHISIALSDSPGRSLITVLSVHVVGSAPGIVPQPDSDVLDSVELGFSNPFALQDFSVGFLGLDQFTDEVPVLGFSNDGVGCEDLHLVDLGIGFLLSWGNSAVDFIFLEDSSEFHLDKLN